MQRQDGAEIVSQDHGYIHAAERIHGGIDDAHLDGPADRLRCPQRSAAGDDPREGR